MTKCRSSMAPASTETKRRRNQTHAVSIVECAANRAGSSAFISRISHTAARLT